MGTGKLARILIKVSGEALAGDRSFGVDVDLLNKVAGQLIEVSRGGTEIAVVVGGGNIFRGMAVAAGGADRVTADYMGMLGTVINALALGDAIDRLGGSARVFSVVHVPLIAESFTVRGARAAVRAGQIVICGGGTGNPFFTTDTAAALKAVELECDAVLKATKVDGVYASDPVTNPGAERFDRISHDEAISRELKVMDVAAFAIARDNNLPIIVFSLDAEGGIAAVLEKRAPSTRVG
ncbi:MAG TPA: UMP kinase [Devosiaceae bacterium]|nr:UMP kinase [Devosiaceae bacterium]